MGKNLVLAMCILVLAVVLAGSVSALDITAAVKQKFYDSSRSGLCSGDKLTCSQPLDGVTVRLFDAQSADFTNRWTSVVPSTLFQDVYEANIGAIAEQPTDSEGLATFSISSAGKHLVIAKYSWTDSNGKSWTVYNGKVLTQGSFIDTNDDGIADTAYASLIISVYASPRGDNTLINVRAQSSEIISPYGNIPPITGAATSPLATGSWFVVLVVIAGIIAIILIFTSGRNNAHHKNETAHHAHHATHNLHHNKRGQFKIFALIGLMALFGILIAGGTNAATVTCGQLLTADTVMDNDLINCGNGVIFAASNIVLDCQGHTIDGVDAQSSKGVSVSTVGNATIKNCVITDFDQGISLMISSNNKILNNNLNSNMYYYAGSYYGSGIYVMLSNNSYIANNVANSNSYGIVFAELSHNNTLVNNTANFNQAGIFSMSINNNNNLIGNTANGNTYGSGISVGGSNNILANNIANSNNMYGIAAGSGSGNVLTNNIASSNSIHGISISGSNNSLTNNAANSNTGYGIYLSTGSNNNIVNNTANSNSYSGIYLSSSFNNNIAKNIANSNIQWGIRLQSSSNNNITNNTFGSNSMYGIGLYSSSYNNLTFNTINSNQNGIEVKPNSNYNTFNFNTVSLNNIFGIVIEGGAIGNIISQNDIYKNARLCSGFCMWYNSWTNGPVEISFGGIGNFWGHADPAGPCFYVNGGAYTPYDSYRADTTDSYCSYRMFNTNDTTPPTTSGTYNCTLGDVSGWCKTAAIVTLNATDVDPGVALTKYCIDTTNTCTPVTKYTAPFAAPQGTNTIRYQSWDYAGNLETIKSIDVSVDSLPPAVISAIITPSIVGTTAQITITKVVTDVIGTLSVNADIKNSANTIVGTVALSLVSGTAQSGSWSGTFDFGSLPDGTYRVTDNLADTNGNSQTVVDGTVILDRTQPTVSLISITPAYPMSSQTITIKASAMDTTSGISAITAQDITAGTNPVSLPLFSGSTGPGQTGTFQGTMTAGLPEGGHDVKIVAKDMATPANENSVTALSIFTVDDYPPTTTATVDCAMNNGWCTSAPTISLSATDSGAGVASTRYCNSYTDWFCQYWYSSYYQQYYYNSYTAPLTISGYEGSFDIKYYSVDAASRIENYNTLTMNVDYGAPSLSVTNSPATPWTSAAQPTTMVTLTATASDSYSGVAEIVIYLDSSPIQTCSSATECIIELGPYSAGETHEYYATARDAAGNIVDTLPSEKALWKFDEDTGIATDSIDAHDGTINGATWTADGKIGGGMSFDGSENYVYIPASSSFAVSAGFTIDVWVNPSELKDYAGIVSKTDGYGNNVFMTVLHSDGSMGIYSPSSDWRFSPPGLVSPGVWTHVVWKYDGANIYFYVNDALVSSSSMIISDSLAYPLLIGRWYLNSPGYYAYSGLMDEVKFTSGMSHGFTVAEDTTPPTATIAPNQMCSNQFGCVSFTDPVNGCYADYIQFSATVSDDLSRVQTVKYYFDGIEASDPYVYLPSQGSHTYYMTVTDNAGFATTTPEQSFTIVGAISTPTDLDADCILCDPSDPLQQNNIGCNDNCPMVYNPDQADSNNDYIGNACTAKLVNDKIVELAGGPYDIYGLDAAASDVAAFVAFADDLSTGEEFVTTGRYNLWFGQSWLDNVLRAPASGVAIDSNRNVVTMNYDYNQGTYILDKKSPTGGADADWPDGGVTFSNYQFDAYYSAIAADDAGNVYVSGYDNNGGYAILKIDQSGNIVWSTWQQGFDVGYYATSIAIAPSGDVFAAVNNNIYKFDSNGNYVNDNSLQNPDSGCGMSYYNYVQMLDVDSSGNVWIVAPDDCNWYAWVLKYDSDLNWQDSFIVMPYNAGAYYELAELKVLPNGNVVVAGIFDWQGYGGGSSAVQISEYDQNGNMVKGATYDSGNYFRDSKFGLAVDEDGNVIVIYDRARYNDQVGWEIGEPHLLKWQSSSYDKDGDRIYDNADLKPNAFSNAFEYNIQGGNFITRGDQTVRVMSVTGGVELKAAGSAVCEHACGNDITEPYEECDGSDIGMATCASVSGNPGATGTLGCAADCTFDTSSCTIPACDVSGTVGLWKFDDDTGVATDSIDAHDGTLNGPTWTADGKISGGMSFDGYDNYINVPASNDFAISNGFTIEAWVNPSEMKDYSGIVSKTDGYGSYVYMAVIMSDGSLSLYSNQYGWVMSSGGLVNSGTWTHIAWVWDGSNINFYVNGVLDSSSGWQADDNSAYQLMIGKWYLPFSWDYTFSGLMDEVAVYNRAIGAGEIANIYNAGSVARCGSPFEPELPAGCGAPALYTACGDPTPLEISDGQAVIIDQCVDLDGDGVGGSDNCPTISNADQIDSDATLVELSFTHPNYGSEEDCIESGVCLFRGASGPIYNTQSSTIEWACGECGSETSQYYPQITDLYQSAACLPGDMTTLPGTNTCMHILDSDNYWGMAWESWTAGGAGGGFSYTRTSGAPGDNVGDACDCNDGVCDAREFVSCCAEPTYTDETLCGSPCAVQQCTDADGDGYGATGSIGCAKPEVDCNDNNRKINPGRKEKKCDGIDNDCNPLTLDNPDTDGDTFGDCEDNCPLLPNNDQNDANNDGIGEACSHQVDRDNVQRQFTNGGKVAGLAATDMIIGLYDEIDGLGQHSEKTGRYNLFNVNHWIGSETGTPVAVTLSNDRNIVSAGATALGNDFTVTKYDKSPLVATGGIPTVLWTKTFDNSGNADAAKTVSTDSLDNVYATGITNNIPFVTKLNSAGNYVWTPGIKELAGYESLYDSVVDSAGNIYAAVAGADSGSGRAMNLLKFDTNGLQVGSSESVEGTSAAKIAVDSSGKVYALLSNAAGGKELQSYDSSLAYDTSFYVNSDFDLYSMTASSGTIVLAGKKASAPSKMVVMEYDTTEGLLKRGASYNFTSGFDAADSYVSVDEDGNWVVLATETTATKQARMLKFGSSLKDSDSQRDRIYDSVDTNDAASSTGFAYSTYTGAVTRRTNTMLVEPGTLSLVHLKVAGWSSPAIAQFACPGGTNPRCSMTDGGNANCGCGGSLDFEVFAGALDMDEETLAPGTVVHATAGAIGSIDFAQNSLNVTMSPSSTASVTVNKPDGSTVTVLPGETQTIEVMGCGQTITTDTILNSDLLNCPGSGLVIGANGITLDCAGHTIDGIDVANTFGVNDIGGFDNVVVKNCIISDFLAGVYFENSNNGEISGNTLTSNSRGIILWAGTNNIVSGNTANANTYLGIIDVYGAGSIISGNNAYSNSYDGIALDTTTNAIIKDNNVYSNSRRGISLGASPTSIIYHNNIYSNVNKQLYTDTPIELSFNGAGNFWGRTTAPYFIAGTDTNLADAVDSSPYSKIDGWVTNCGDVITANKVLENDLINCSGNGITIGANNITLDCAGHTITGSGTGYGVNINSKSNVAIKNCVLRNFQYGIFLWGSYNTVSNVDASGNGTGAAIYLTYSARYNNITNNIGRNRQYGIVFNRENDYNRIVGNDFSYAALDGLFDEVGFSDHDNNLISGNDLSHAGRYGILFDGVNNIFQGNNVSYSANWGIYLRGYNASVAHDNDFTNSANGLGIGSNTTVENWGFKPYNIPGIVLGINGLNNIIRNVDVSGAGAGFGIRLFYSANHNNITNVTGRNRRYGLAFDRNNDYNNIVGNNFSYSTARGLTDYGWFLDHDNNLISGNDFSYAAAYGIAFGGANNTITKNIMTGSQYGLVLANAGSSKVYHNNIYGNSVKNVNSDQAIELSYNQQGNFWGRTTAPYFIAGTDSNAANVVDSYPYNSANAWNIVCGPHSSNIGGSCACDAGWLNLDGNWTTGCESTQGCGQTITANTVLNKDYTCYGTAFTIGTSGVTLDCAGYSITGFGTESVNTGNNGVTIQNCVVVNGSIANYGSNGRITNNAIRFGEIHARGSGNSITNNRIDNTGQTKQIVGSIWVFGTNHLIADNEIKAGGLSHPGFESSGAGIAFTTWGTYSNTTVRNNTIENCSYTGIVIEYGSPGYFVEGNTITNCAGAIYAESANSTLSHNTISNSGAMSVSGDGTTISENTITNNNAGIWYAGANGKIASNKINNSAAGIETRGLNILVSGNELNNIGIVGSKQCMSGAINIIATDKSTIEQNIVSNINCVASWGSWYAVAGGIAIIAGSDNNTVRNNVVTNVTGEGIYVGYAGENKISENTISGSTNAGIRTIYVTANNIASDNDVFNNKYGVLLTSAFAANPLSFYHNNVYSNSVRQAQSDFAIELSYNQEGNFWGRTTAPYFIAGTDSNAANVVDSYPYGVKDGWKCIDNDADGYGITGNNIACEHPGVVDCDDNNTAVNPGAAEVCDGVDNNCASGVDDGIADTVTDVYGKDNVGECRTQIESCIAGGWQITQNAVGPSAETCDLLDNDCNGLSDAADSSLVKPLCELQQGVCLGATHAAAECSDGVWQSCAAADYGSSYGEQELCPDDGVDNNCDGDATIDCAAACDKDSDGYKPDNAPWYCLWPFYQSGDCNDFSGSINPGAADALCNGIDENCNNVADDEYFATATDCGVGGCAATGQLLCQNGQLSDSCAPGQPTDEVCDNADNNCNSLTDEGIADIITDVYGSDSIGECKTKTERCSAGIWDIIQQPVGPSAELCDNLDNNCDAQIDDGLAQSCYTGPDGTQGIGACQGGTSTCAAGAWGSCAGEVTPQTEITCNGIDENCNGIADDTPDSDGDGVNDCVDACKTVAGIASRQGCPYGDLNIVELHYVDQAKTGVCGTAGSCKVALAGASVRIFDRNNAAFQSLWTKNPNGELYAQVYENSAGKIASCATAADGKCTAGESYTGDFLVIVKYYDSATGKTVYTGKPKGASDFVNGLATKDFQVIKTLKKDGTVQFSGGSKVVVTGSFLEIIYPENVIWETTSFVYPFIFTSDSDWTVDVCAQVPTGYDIIGVYDENGNLVASTDCVQTFVAGQTKVVAFDVLETGSPEPNLKASFNLKHNGKSKKVDLEVKGKRLAKGRSK